MKVGTSFISQKAFYQSISLTDHICQICRFSHVCNGASNDMKYATERPPFWGSLIQISLNISD